MFRNQVTVRLLVFLALAFGLIASAQAQSFVYANNTGSPNGVIGFSVGPNGALTRIPGSPFATGGNSGGGYYATRSIAIWGNFLFAANEGSNSVAAFVINPSTGVLTAAPGSPFPISGVGSGSGISLAVSPAGNYLFTGSNGISVQAIGANGALTQVSSITMSSFIDTVAVSPDGLFLAYTDTQHTGIYNIGSNGSLTVAPGSPISANLGGGSGTSVIFTPNLASGNRLYVGAAGSAVVAAYSVSSTGALTAIPGSPFTFSGASNPNSIGISADGRHVFLANQQCCDHSPVVLNIGSNGALTLAYASVPSGASSGTALNIATSADGKFLFSGSYGGPIFDFGIGSGGVLSSPNVAAMPSSSEVSVAAYPALGINPFAIVSPSSLSFSSPVGAPSAVQTVTVTNIGQNELTISDATIGGANPNDFSVENNCTFSLAFQHSCTLNVFFTPRAGGARSATLSITDDSGAVNGSVQTVAFQGTGLKQTPSIDVLAQSVPYGTAATPLTATISFAGSLLPTGALTFSVNGGPAFSATCAGSQSPLTCTASYPTGALAVNGYNVSAALAADSNFNSASGVGTLSVFPAPQTITFPALAGPVSVNSASPLSATSSSGAPVLYSITAGSASIDNNTITFTNSGSVTVQADSAATANYTAAPSVVQTILVNPAPSSYVAPATAVGATSSVQTATVNFTTGGTVGSSSVVTQGALNKDFNVAPGGTCTGGAAYTAGQACTVNYTFTPQSPGAREGAVVLQDASGNVLGTSYLGGTGIGPLGLFTTDTQTLGISGLSTVRGISLDGNGNLYGFETFNGSVDMFPTGSTAKKVVATLPASSQGGATAIDGAGNLFVMDSAAAALYEFVGGTGSPITVLSNIPPGDDNLEIDGAGNIYYSGYGGNDTGAIYEISAATHQVTTLVAGGTGSRFVAMAVDPAGNIYAPDFNNNVLYELPAGSHTLITLGSGGYLANPHGIAVDPAGNIYVSNYYGNTVIRYAAGTHAATLMPAKGQKGIALDGSGNLYTITSDSTIAEYTRTQAAPFTFANTPVGITSNSQNGVVFENDGNADLVITGYSATAPFALNGGQNTCAVGTLASGGSCVVGATFNPTATGPNTGTATITDNTLGVAGTAQSITLSGFAIQQTPTIAASAATINYSSDPTVLSATVSFVGSVVPAGAVTLMVDGGAAVTAACTGSSSPLNCTASYPTGTLSASSHRITASIASDANFTTASGSATLTVNPIAPTISFPVANHTYGDGAVTLAATSNSTGTFTYSVVTGPATISGNVLKITGAGAVTVQASQAANGNYTVGAQNASFTITQAQLAVSVAGTPTKTYDGTNAATLSADNFAVTGLVGSDSITINQTAGTYAAASAGPESVNATLAPANYAAASGSLSNYVLPTSATGAGLINQALATVTVNAGAKVYAQADPALTGTLSGFVASDNVTATYARAAGETVLGSPYAISATLAPQGVLSNYKITYNQANFTITPAPLAVTASDVTRQYGAANPAFTGNIVGIVNGDVISATYSTTATAASAVGSYAIVPTPTGAALSNYAVTVNNGALTVTAAPLVVTPTDASRAYGSVNPVFSGAISGIQNNDPITATYSTTATIASDPGTYSIVAQLSDPQSKLSNYSVTLNTGTLTIAKANQTIVWATPTAITYGTPLSAAQLSAAISVPGPTAAGAATYTPAAGTVLDAGVQTLTVTVAGTTDYNPATATVQLTVNKAQPVFSSLKDASVTYHTASVTFTGALSAPTAIPAGQQIAVTVNNVTQNAVVGSNGSFTTTFNTAALPVSATGYTVSYSYAGSNDFTAAAATSRLTLSYAVCDLYNTVQAKQSGSTYPISVAVCDVNNQNVGTSGMVLTAVGWGALTPAYSPVPDAGNSNGNGTFRNTGNSFMWNLKTKGIAAGNYNMFFTISGDPTLHHAPFAVR